jgi:hypothetical protein
LRVTYLDHVGRVSGAEIALVRLIEAVGPELEATVILAENGELVERLGAAGARVEVLPLAEEVRGMSRREIRPGLRQAYGTAEVARYTGRLRRRLRDLRPDLVHTTSLKASVYGMVAARAAGLPVLWHLHDRLARDYLPSAVVPPMRLLAATAPTALVAPSRFTLETVGRRFRRGMVVAALPNAVPYPERAVEVRDEVETVTMIGRLTWWKGQHVFLEAFARAFPDRPVQARLVRRPPSERPTTSASSGSGRIVSASPTVSISSASFLTSPASTSAPTCLYTPRFSPIRSAPSSWRGWPPEFPWWLRTPAGMWNTSATAGKGCSIVPAISTVWQSCCGGRPRTPSFAGGWLPERASAHRS